MKRSTNSYGLFHVRNVYAFESNTCDFDAGDAVNATILSGRVNNGASKPAATFPVTQVVVDFSGGE